jgi:RHS repeat-associated protein
VWSADYGWTSGHSAYTTTNTIANTNAQPLYQSSSYNIYPLIYSFTAPNGSYTVTLKFAEVYWGGMGQRPMNILLNGTTVATGFDASAAAGGSFRAIDRQYTVPVTTGQIVIELDPVSGSGSTPSINGIEITAAGGGGGTLTTNYTYDIYGHLTQVSMPRSNGTQTRTFVYDANQRLQSTANPENGTVTYSYNTDGTMATKVDAKNQKIAYVYDANQRVSQIQRYPVSTGAEDQCQRVTFTYGTSAPSLGRVSNATWGASTNCAALNNHTFVESYTYNNPGSVMSKSLAVDGVALTSSHTYDNEGKMLTAAYPASGPVFTYAFDNKGRPNKMTDGLAVDWVKGVTYGVAGEMTDMLWRAVSGPVQSGVYNTEHRTYNARLQLTGILAAGFTYQNSVWSAATLLDETYTYVDGSNNGRISKKKETRTNATEELTFSYDALNRLASAVTTAQPPGETWGPQWSQTFQFDGFGNLTGQAGTGGAPNTSWAVDAATNRLSGSGIAYDANGNLTQNGSLYMSYDVDNRLASVNAGSEYYGYAPDNKRVWKKKPGGAEEYYFYGVTGQRLGTYQKSGSVWTAASTNVYFGGRMVVSNGESVAMDRLGSVRQTNRYGSAPVWSRYYPYGVEQTATLEDREKFGTYYRDATTGLDYADQRYYGSTVGRFLTVDPYGDNWDTEDPTSWNGYGYVNGDPVNFNDPEGLKCDDVRLFGGAGIPQGTTVAAFLSANSNLSVFTTTIFTETRIGWDSLALYEKAAVASVIMNRWQFVNQYFDLYTRPVGGKIRSNPVSVSPYWGSADGTIGSVVYAPRQFAVWAAAGVLEAGSQRRLDSARAADETSEQCLSLLQSIGTAVGFWAARDNHALYVAEDDLVFTSFGSGGGANRAFYEDDIGRFGSANEFYGVSISQVLPHGVSPPGRRIPRPRPPRRPDR